MKSAVRLIARIRLYARHFGYGRLLCLLLLIGISWFAGSRPVSRLKNCASAPSTAIRSSSRARRRSGPFVIIDIDEKSLAKFGQWPWPRTRVAESRQAAHRSRRGRHRLRHRLCGSRTGCRRPSWPIHFAISTEESRAKLRTLPSNDQVLADVLRQSPTILGEIRPAEVRPATGFEAAVDGARHAGRRSAAVSAEFPGAAPQCPPFWKKPRRAADCSRSAPSVTASCAASR